MRPATPWIWRVMVDDASYAGAHVRFDAPVRWAREVAFCATEERRDRQDPRRERRDGSAPRARGSDAQSRASAFPCAERAHLTPPPVPHQLALGV